MVPSEACVAGSGEFWVFLPRHNEAALRVAQHLSMELHAAWAQTRMLALAPNARAKMAQLLLMWADRDRSEEHTSELQSHLNLVCRLLLEKKKCNTSTLELSL